MPILRGPSLAIALIFGSISAAGAQDAVKPRRPSSLPPVSSTAPDKAALPVVGAGALQKPEPEADHSFSGFYAGAQAGFGRSGTDGPGHP